MQRFNIAAGVVAFLLFPFTAGAAPELSGTPDELLTYLKEPAPQVQFSAQAEETAYSDIAKLTLVLTTEADELEAAIAANGSLRDKISQTLMSAGIPADKINTAKFSTSPQFGWFGDKPNSYEVANRMRVEVSTAAQLKAVAAAVDSGPEIEMGGIEFEHSERDATEEAVLGQALDKVLSEKAVYEAKLGLKLTPVSVSRRQVMPVARRAYAEPVLMERVAADSAGSGAEVGYDSAAVTFDEVRYTAFVAVTFEVERP